MWSRHTNWNGWNFSNFSFKWMKNRNKQFSGTSFLSILTPIIFNSLSIKSYSSKEVFLYHFTVLRDTKLQEFQFKLLYDIDYELLVEAIWALWEWYACTSCGIECESVLHIFWSCRYAADVRSEVEKWWFTNTQYTSPAYISFETTWQK